MNDEFVLPSDFAVWEACKQALAQYRTRDYTPTESEIIDAAGTHGGQLLAAGIRIGFMAAWAYLLHREEGEKLG